MEFRRDPDENLITLYASPCPPQALYSTPGYSGNSSGKGKGIANATQQQKELYTYDLVGNRLSSDLIKSYVYNPGNQLVVDGGNYTYDKNGNLLQKMTADGTTTYAWDYENRLVKVVTPDGTTTQFAYDPFGRRIVKKETENGANTATHYFYDNGDILFEYDDAGTMGNRYTHGLGTDEHLRVDTGKGKYYYHADGLGSIIAVTDTAGTAVQTYQYDSYGNLKDQKNRVKQPYSYTGREWDKECGLYYYRARYYDPMEGRFISKDPIGFKGGINLYGYVGNNPINLIDPYGLSAWDTIKNFGLNVLGALLPDFGPNAVSQVALDPEAAKSGLAVTVNKYNKDRALDGSFDTMDPAWASQHPLEALQIISDYYKNKKKQCPTK